MSALPRAARALAAALLAPMLAALLIAPAADARASSPTALTAAPAPAPAPRSAPVMVNPSNPATPGSFTGHGFDQCLAPSQAAMDTWLNASPFLAAGIYISGYSRGCRNQPNLTPTWIATQLANGWRLLPITLGPQASCSTRYPRYHTDATINPAKTNGTYAAAIAQGTAEADKTLAVAASLGLTPGSTMYYDLEAYDISKKACKESALAFLSAWTVEIKAHGYLSGVYSSAGSGLKALDMARAAGLPYAYPDQIWIADWNGRADTASTYLSPYGWADHQRIHQYQGGHTEKWGGVTINIDRNFLDVGRGSVATPETHCRRVGVDFTTYPNLVAPAAGTTLNPALKPYVKALKCLLKERGGFKGRTTPRFNKPLVRAIAGWSGAHGRTTTGTTWNKRWWLTLFATGTHPVIKYGSTGPAVRDLQRALLVTKQKPKPAVTGVFDAATQAALVAYQDKRKVAFRGVAGPATWAALAAGKR